MTPSATTSSLSIWQQLKEAAVPVATWWLLLLWSFATFFAVIVVTKGFDLESFIAMGVIAACTFPGAAIGQAMAFLRVRSWIVVLFGALCWGLSFALGIGASAVLGEIGVFVFLALFLLPIALTGGLWSLETHRSLWATWLPLLFTTSSILLWAEFLDNDANWFAGEKWRIWDVVTLGVLGTSIVLLLLFLVSRETHRLALWRRGPTAPLAPSLVEKGATRPRLTPFGALLLLGLAAALTVATALISPYLWRTGPGGDEDGDGGERSQQEDGRARTSGQGDGEGGGMSEGTKKMLEQGVEAAKQGGAAVCSMLTLALLAIIGTLVAYRPLRRLFLLRHLRDPFWQVSPTARVEQGWRLVEIALGDVGVHPRPGEDAAGLARRARPALQALSPVEVHGLEDAAEVADRVRFGLGVDPRDLAVMQRFSAWAIDTVWERIGDREQVRCMYRQI